MYDFDELIDRSGSGCIKLDWLRDMFGCGNLLPLWIADMDFRTPDFIVDALRKRLEHPVFGYTAVPDCYFKTIAEWVERLHGWQVSPEHIRYIPGIVKGIGMVIDAFLKLGDKVLVQPPVYHPFHITPQKKGFEVVYNPLIPVYEDGCGLPEDMLTKDADRRLVSYKMDFDALERMLAEDSGIKLMILANPHNPAGICWCRETLERLAEITARYGVLVVSDEIHAEMALSGSRHLPYASVNETAARNSITFMAPSKTFNIAGIVSSYTIVPDAALRERFFNFLEAGELDMPAIFAPVATMAAYTKGWEWRREMLGYVQANIDYVDEWLRTNLPQIRCVRPDASFLIWLDCRSLRLEQCELVSLFVNKAHLAMNDGSMFGQVAPDGHLQGTEGCGFMRMNVGCPRSVLTKALESLRDALTNN